MAAPATSKDGYYVRDLNNEVHGPYTEQEFDSMRIAGEIDIMKPKSAWRMAMGMAYRVSFKRRYNSIFSCTACGHAWELFIILFTSIPFSSTNLIKLVNLSFAACVFMN